MGQVLKKTEGHGHWRAPRPVYVPVPPNWRKRQAQEDKEYDITEEMSRGARKAPTSYLGQDARVPKKGFVTFSAVPRFSMPPPGTAAFRAYSESASASASMRGARKQVASIQREMAETGWPDDS